MKRLIVDMSSVIWKALLAGTDKEFGYTVEHNGREVKVNSANYGYENAMNMLVGACNRFGIVPQGVLLVVEGVNSKAKRQYIDSQYKDSRGSRPEAAYNEFNALKERLVDTWCGVGASAVWQDGIEADDVIGYLCKNLQGERYVLSSDGDLAVLVTEDVHLWRNDELDPLPYGPFPHKYITAYKALVGDTGDNIKGVPGFGEKAFLNFLVNATDDDLEYLDECLRNGQLHTLKAALGEFPMLKKVVENVDAAYKGYALAKLYIEDVNTMRRPLQWRVGMPLKASDERVRKWGQQTRLVTASNYAKACEFLRSKIETTPWFCLDLETTVPEESDEWLARRGNGSGVDVIGSTIVSCAVSFGDNLQYALYLSVDHAGTDNLTLTQLREFLEEIPKDKITVAHNAAGFELPVMYNAWGSEWENNGWRGFFPNMVDTRIAASYWDENQHTHGLKALSKLLLNYDQTTYDEVTGGRKMNELTAEETVAYGVDDVFTAGALWVHFQRIMEIEKSLDTFLGYEQKPMYLSAMGYVNGIRMDIGRLNTLSESADVKFSECELKLNNYLISQGWDGTQCPVFKELTEAAQVKQLVSILLPGVEFKTQTRTVSKLAILIGQLDHPNAALLSKMVVDLDVDTINKWVAREFCGKPNFDVASPKQVSALMYETMGLPVRLRNKVTAVMRKKGVREGTARTDEDAMKMAIKYGDCSEEVAEVLKALIDMKSINTERGLYYKPYPSFVHWKTGRVHPELRQSATVTRRYTSANFNVQQLNSDYGGIRTVIIPHHHNAVIVSLDESAQEVRCMADLSGDENLATCYVGPKELRRDVHSIVGSRVAGIGYDEFYSALKCGDADRERWANSIRQMAKITLFSYLYGASAPKIAETLGISVDEAQGYIDALSAQFPKVAEWKAGIEDFTSVNGYAPLMLNTRRHLAKYITSEDGYERSKALRQASNAAIQSSCALQLKGVMTKIWDSEILDKYDVKWYAPVHDEGVLSVGKDDAVPAIKELHDIMCYQFLKTIPSASSIGIGRNFGELVELGEVFDPAKISKTIDDLFTVKD